jgi:NADH-quinone oxidoreductase subunit M
MLEQVAPYFDKTLLSWLLGLPFLGTFALLFMPRQAVQAIRSVSVGLMLAEFALSLRLLSGDYGASAHQFAISYELVPRYGISLSAGVDGISLWLVLLTTFVMPLALFGSWTSVNMKVKEFALCFLFLEGAMIGAFVALDLFLFYVFWELVLIPTYFLVGIWGGKDRIFAAFKFFLYTTVGSLLMFVAIVYVAGAYYDLTGVYTFDIRKLSELVLDANTQLVLFLAFALAFAIKIPLFPFHTWVPVAYVQAPTGGTVVLTAVLLKMGTYGFIRFAMPLFPLAANRAGPTLCVFAVIGILYGAYCAWAQTDVKRMVAYSSISHLGFVLLGIFSATRQGVGGALLQMVNHGISTGALFLLIGVIHERRHTRSLAEFGGLAKNMPVYTLLFLIVAMSSIGLPGTNGFVGEFMILNGTFLSRKLPTPFFFSLAATLGVVLAAVYMLNAVRKMFWGPLDKTENQQLPDLGKRELLTLLPLVAMVFVLGLGPSIFLTRIDGSVNAFLRNYERKMLDSHNNDRAHLLKLQDERGYALAADE